MPNLNIQTPPGWRIGQTLFNFLVWLNRNGYNTQPIGIEASHSFPYKNLIFATDYMADPFYIPDNKLEELYNEFLLTTSLDEKGKE